VATFNPLSALLAEHGLTGVPEQPFDHAGFSGAALTRLVRGDGCAFILKRMSLKQDWIMRATDDLWCREAALAAAAPDLGDGLETPVLGAASDGDAHALLMRDISAHLLSSGAITTTQLDVIISRMAELHARPAPDGLPWCDLTRRLTLHTRATARVAEAYGAQVAHDIINGWRLFDELAPPRASDIVRGLQDDPSPLVVALNRAPAAFLHGDLKLDNIGLDAAGRMWLIDWAMTLVAPPAVELGWFIAINSRRLPLPLDDVIARYASAARMPRELRARHDALTVLCGLLLRGWRKALDAAAGDGDELRWWCERVEAAAAFL
jgi:Phosphotransferase enzyme family